jgi:hypothetical protein
MGMSVFADHGVVTEFEVVEELLAELHRPVDLFDATQRNSGAVDRHHEHRQALVLGHVPIGTGQHQAVVGGERAGAPCLGAVDHPLVADAVGPGDDTGEIRSATGFRQQLHEHFITAQRGGDVREFLCLTAHVEDRRAADGERRDVENERHLVAGRLGVERLLVFVPQAAPAVLRRKADPREPTVVEDALKVAGPLPGGVAAVLERGWIRRVDPWHVLRQPGPCPCSELLNRFGGHQEHLTADSASLPKICSDGNAVLMPPSIAIRSERSAL